MTTLNRNRSVALTPALLQAVCALIESARSPGDAVRALREAGFQAGESFYALFAGSETDEDSLAPDRLPSWRFWERFSDFWASNGWGELKHRELHPGVSVLESSDWIEAEITHAVAGCHLSTGILAEVLRQVAGQEIAVMETTCRSRGDAVCSFLIGSPETLQALYAELSRGATVDEAVAALA